MNDKLIQTRVPKDIYKKVAKLAEESGCSMATYLRQMLIREVKGQEPLQELIDPFRDCLGEVRRGSK